MKIRDAAKAHADFLMVQSTARVALAVKAAQTWLKFWFDTGGAIC